MSWRAAPRLGPWSECLERVGHDPAELKRKLMAQVRQHRSDARAVARDLTRTLAEDGHLVAYDGRVGVLHFNALRVRLRSLWPTLGEAGRVWLIQVARLSTENDFELLVRMDDGLRPLDFFLAPPADRSSMRLGECRPLCSCLG